MITLLAMTLLVGLIFYVYNVGLQVNRRLELQNAADSAAASGATWMARSMNVIAMNNVTQARMIALSIVLDSLPLAAEMTVAEETGDDSVVVPLREQLARGIPSTSLERHDFLRRGLVEIHRQMNQRQAAEDPTHIDLIELVDRTLDQDDERQLEGVYNVRQATQWMVDGNSGPPPHGSAWRAARAVDELSQAVAISAGILAQSDASRFGRDSGARAAMLSPVLPRIPAYRGSIGDFEAVLADHIRVVEDPGTNHFEHAVVHSNLVETLRTSPDLLKTIEQVSVHGGAIPDFAWPHRLGPFARVYGWRDYVHRQENEWWEEDYRVFRVGYTTYGPIEHAIGVVLDGFGQMGARGGIAYTSRFPHHVRRIANLKLAYLLGLDSPRAIQYADRWMGDFQQAKKFAEANPEKVLRARYYRVAVDSKVLWTDSRWLTGQPGETPEERIYWSAQIHPDLSGPITDQPLWEWATEPWGWSEPPAANTTKVMDHVWVRKYERKVRDFQPFNWPPRPIYNDRGEIIGYDEYTLYRVEWYVWGGMELRDEVEISNPVAGAAVDDLPAPILLDTSGGDYDPERPDPDAGVRWDSFSFLGLAGQTAKADIWPQRFSSQNPEEFMAAVAQAKLFNNRSWDLWTQAWQVQLTPVSRWKDRMARLEAELADVPATEGAVDQTDADFFHRYLSRISERLTEQYMNH